MPADGRILRGSLSSVNGDNPSDTAFISIVLNGQVIPRYTIQKSSNVYSNTLTYQTPIEVVQNYRINFQTTLSTLNATNNIVSLLIELDL